MRGFYNRPLALLPSELSALLAAPEPSGAQASVYLDGEASPRRDVGWDLVAGVAVIHVAGILVQRTGSLRPWGWGDWSCTGYDGIRENLLTALADDAVRAIVLAIDSPGGEVAGCFDLVDMIVRARGKKPLVAIAAESACSAAYALASACDRVTVPRTGVLGSVGVVCAHADFSGMLTQAGIVVTLIQFGARKTDGAPTKPLDSPALARFQADIDSVGELFVATVAANRRMSPAAVRAMEGATYLGVAAVAEGLADAVAAPDDEMRRLIASLG